jgi:predicted extracellular nuclease
MGDLNDDRSSPPLQELARIGFVDLLGSIPPTFRYTYVHRGTSQTLDYILWRPSFMLTPLAVSAVHVNADYPAEIAKDIYSYHRSSDHDPVWARFGVGLVKRYLPFTVR